MVSNPGEHGWIPNAANNPWANCPEKDPDHAPKKDPEFLSTH